MSGGRSDETAGKATILIASLSTMVALALGIVIAYSTANSITKPLSELMKVARQIGESGDLDHRSTSDAMTKSGNWGAPSARW